MKSEIDKEYSEDLFDESVLTNSVSTETIDINENQLATGVDQTLSIISGINVEEYEQSGDDFLEFEKQTFAEINNEATVKSSLSDFISDDEGEPDSPFESNDGNLLPPPFEAEDEPDHAEEPNESDLDELIQQIQQLTKEALTEHEFAVLKEAMLAGLHRQKALELVELHKENPLEYAAFKKATEELLNAPKTPTKVIYEALLTAGSLKMGAGGIGITKQNNSSIPNQSNMFTPNPDNQSNIGFRDITDDEIKGTSDSQNTNNSQLYSKVGNVAKALTAEGANSIASLSMALAGSLFGAGSGLATGVYSAIKGRLNGNLKGTTLNTTSPTDTLESQFDLAAEKLHSEIKKVCTGSELDKSVMDNAIATLGKSAMRLMGSTQSDEEAFDAHAAISKRIKEINDLMGNESIPEDLKKTLQESVGGLLDLIQKQIEELYQVVRSKFIDAIGLEKKETASMAL